MFNLHLEDPEKSEIKFEVQSFPDGQKDVRLTAAPTAVGLAILRNQDVKIYTRLNNGDDLLILLSATAALRRLFVKDIFLHLPYLLGARSDRQFVKGGTSWLVDVLAPVLRAQNYRTINVLDVHSDVAAACLPNLLNQTNTKFVEWALGKINTLTPTRRHPVLVVPDAGALKKVYGLAEELLYTGPLAIGQKHRDLVSGNILSTSVDIPREVHTDQDFFIVDDICDGGRTFIELAKALREHRRFGEGLTNEEVAERKIYLLVTHGIFSKGYKELNEVFDGIYCTNSYQQVPLDTYDGYHSHPTGVHCLNVF